MTQETTFRDEIVSDFTIRIIVDDVSEGKGTEFRATIYDEALDLVCDSWGDTPKEAVAAVLKTYEQSELTTTQIIQPPTDKVGWLLSSYYTPTL